MDYNEQAGLLLFSDTHQFWLSFKKCCGSCQVSQISEQLIEVSDVLRNPVGRVECRRISEQLIDVGEPQAAARATTSRRLARLSDLRSCAPAQPLTLLVLSTKFLNAYKVITNKRNFKRESVIVHSRLIFICIFTAQIIVAGLQ